MRSDSALPLLLQAVDHCIEAEVDHTLELVREAGQRLQTMAEARGLDMGRRGAFQQVAALLRRSEEALERARTTQGDGDPVVLELGIR